MNHSYSRIPVVAGKSRTRAHRVNDFPHERSSSGTLVDFNKIDDISSQYSSNLHGPQNQGDSSHVRSSSSRQDLVIARRSRVDQAGPHQALSQGNTRQPLYHSEQTAADNDDDATTTHFATMVLPVSDICERLRVAQGTNIRENRGDSSFSYDSRSRAQFRLPRPFVNYQNELPTYHEAVLRSPTMDRLDILQYGLGFACFVVGLLLSLLQGAFLFPVGLKVGAASLVLYVGFYALFAVPFFFKQQSVLAIPCCFLTFGICTVSTLAWARQAAIYGVL